jgi:ATP-dependent DNA ligase
MRLDVKRTLIPMDALSVDQIPTGAVWQYEPKWDGFRCLAFRNGTQVDLRSKGGQPLGRYFPELVDALQDLTAKRFVLDGEIVVPFAKKLSFDHLLMRIHPAVSRIRKLAAETPARMIVFDLLADASGRSLLSFPLAERRARLEAFAAKQFPRGGRLRLSPATSSLRVAKKWFGTVGGDLDGLIAKRLDAPYRPGERTAMQKIKRRRSADCVIGGFRFGAKSRLVGSLLLGLYDSRNRLNHVGFCAGFKADDRVTLTQKLKKLVGPPAFTGRAPGRPSRWSTKRSQEWHPLKPQLVVEVGFDHVSGDRFRHGTQFIRWRPEKSPLQCRMDQLKQKAASRS